MQKKTGCCRLVCIVMMLCAGIVSSGYSRETRSHKPGLSSTQIIDMDASKKHSYSAALYENDRLVNGYTINPDSLARVIVIFREHPVNRQNRTLNAATDRIASEHRQFKNELDQICTIIAAQYNKTPETRIHYEFQTALNGMALTAPRLVTERLASLAMVRSVYPDQQVSINIENSSYLVGADSARKLYHVTGKGVRVGVIDTGMDYNNPALGGGFGPGYRVICGYDFSAQDPDPMDENGHGTFVAGIIGANSAEISGIAPEVQFIAARVLDQNGDGYQSDAIAALEFCMDPDRDSNTDDGAQIINLSLGGAGDENDPLSQAVDQASANGILCVVAAGNYGWTGTAANYQSIDSPGTAKTALTVGAGDLYDRMYYRSAKGPTPLNCYLKPELVAPGVDIRSLALFNATTMESGTSVSAPHVAGAAALLKQQYPAHEGSQLKSMLVHAAKRLAPAYNPCIQGNGRLDILNAFTQKIIVEPAVLSFGRVDNVPFVWSAEIPVTITNPTDSVISVQIYPPQWPDFVSMTIEQTQFIIEPGETVVTDVKLTVGRPLPVPANQPYSYFADLTCIAGGDSFYIPCSVTKAPQLTVTFTQPALSLFLWGEDSPVGYLYSDLPETINIYPDGGRYHLFCVMQQFIDGVRHLYFLEQRNVDVHDLNRLTLDYHQANFQSQPVNYDRDNQPLTAAQLFRNRIAIYFRNDYTVLSSYNMLLMTLNFSLDEELIVNTTALSDNFMYYQNKLYTPQRDRIVFLHQFSRAVTGTQDFWLPDGQDGLKRYAVNMHKNNNDSPGSYLMVTATGYNAPGYATNIHEKSHSIVYNDDLAFNGEVEFSVAPEVGLDDETCSVYSLTCATKDSLQNNYFTSSPGFFINPDGSLNSFYADADWDSSLVNIKNHINLFTLQEGDTLSWPRLNSETLLPDFILTHIQDNIFVTHPGRARGGLHSVAGNYDITPSYCPGGMNYSQGKLFNYNRLLLKQKFANETTELLSLPNSAGNGKSIFLCTSSPYYIHDQYGCSHLLIHQKKAGNAGLVLSLLHFVVRSDNKPAQRLQPGAENTLNIYIRNGDKHLFNPVMTIINQSGQQIGLKALYVGGLHYQTTLPDTLSAGFYGVHFTANDDLGNPFAFIAEPAFYYAADNKIPEPSAFLYMEDYAVADRQNLAITPGAQDLLKLVFHNYGSKSVSGLSLAFADSSAIQINNSDQKWQFTAGQKDSFAIPVTISGCLPGNSLYKTELIASIISNGKRRVQRYPLVFGVAAGSSQVQDGAHPVDDFVYLSHYPNPAHITQGNPGVNFAFDLFSSRAVALDIYNILGRHITRIEKPNLTPGHHTLFWNRTDRNNLPVGSGLYLYRLMVNNKVVQGKLIVLN